MVNIGIKIKEALLQLPFQKHIQDNLHHNCIQKCKIEGIVQKDLNQQYEFY